MEKYNTKIIESMTDRINNDNQSVGYYDGGKEEGEMLNVKKNEKFERKRRYI